MYVFSLHCKSYFNTDSLAVCYFSKDQSILIKIMSRFTLPLRINCHRRKLCRFYSRCQEVSRSSWGEESTGVMEMANIPLYAVNVFLWRWRRKGGEKIEYLGVSSPPPGAPRSSRQVVWSEGPQSGKRANKARALHIVSKETTRARSSLTSACTTERRKPATGKAASLNIILLPRASVLLSDDVEKH